MCDLIQYLLFHERHIVHHLLRIYLFLLNQNQIDERNRKVGSVHNHYENDHYYCLNRTGHKRRNLGSKAKESTGYILSFECCYLVSVFMSVNELYALVLDVHRAVVVDAKVGTTLLRYGLAFLLPYSLLPIRLI